MKNVIKMTLLSGMLIFGVLSIGYTKTLAVTDGVSMKSTGTITYEINTDPTKPVDPTDPDPTNPITPIDPSNHEKSSTGPLSIDYVSNLRFGKQKTSGNDTTYYAELDHFKDKVGKDKNLPNFVQVTDNRGNNAGWHLTMTETEQFKNGEEELKGAILKLDHAISSSADGGTAPTPNQSITLAPGISSDVENANVNQGTGTWLERFGKDECEGKSSISLFVPGKTKKVQGEYKTSIMWTLTDSSA